MDKYQKMAEGIHAAPKSLTRTSCSTRDMTAADDLTHNFTGDPDLTAYFLGKYGQVFIDGKRFTI